MPSAPSRMSRRYSSPERVQRRNSMQRLIQESRTVNEVGSKDCVWGQNAGVVLDGRVLGSLFQTTRSEFGVVLAEAALKTSATSISETARAPGDGVGAVAYAPAFYCTKNQNSDLGENALNYLQVLWTMPCAGAPRLTKGGRARGWRE